MGQVLYPASWSKRTPLEEQLFDDVPFPGIGLRTENLDCPRSAHRAGDSKGGWRISPASVARAFWGGLCVIASLPFVMLFVGAAVFFGALKYLP